MIFCSFTCGNREEKTKIRVMNCRISSIIVCFCLLMSMLNELE